MNIENKMTLRLLFSSILGLALLSFPVFADTISQFKVSGHIYDVSNKSISLNDRFYPYSATVKTFDLKGSPMNTYQLKKGDYVELTILDMGKKRVADSIKLLPDPQKEAK